MANPFLVLGGIAISVATAAFGILQVPGWVASAQDASVFNDLTNVRAAQSAATSQAGKYAPDIATLNAESGVSLTTAAAVKLTVEDEGWCATAKSESGRFFAATGHTSAIGAGVSAKAAARDVGCIPMECDSSEWSGIFFGGTELAGPALAGECFAELNYTHGAGTEPAPGVPGEMYSARFTKTVNDGPGLYTFTLFIDDAAKLFIDGQEVWSFWGALGDPTVRRTIPVQLAAGPHKVVLEYNNDVRSATVNLSYTVTP